jgi:hypothetical protein
MKVRKRMRRTVFGCQDMEAGNRPVEGINTARPDLGPDLPIRPTNRLSGKEQGSQAEEGSETDHIGESGQDDTAGQCRVNAESAQQQRNANT